MGPRPISTRSVLPHIAYLMRETLSWIVLHAEMIRPYPQPYTKHTLQIRFPRMCRMILAISAIVSIYTFQVVHPNQPCQSVIWRSKHDILNQGIKNGAWLRSGAMVNARAAMSRPHKPKCRKHVMKQLRECVLRPGDGDQFLLFSNCNHKGFWNHFPMLRNTLDKTHNQRPTPYSTRKILRTGSHPKRRASPEEKDNWLQILDCDWRSCIQGGFYLENLWLTQG